MNDLERFFWQESDRYIHKWINYFKYYDRYFSKYRNRPIKVLEIGVWKGGSLQMWKNYFGENCLIVGMDIDNECNNYIEDRIEVFIGNQGDTNDLGKLIGKYDKFDVIIDDGSHLYKDQLNSFEYLYDYLNTGGVYLIEDTHTAYWPVWHNSKDNIVEFAKNIIDDLTAYHALDGHEVTKYTQTLSGIYFHDSMIFFEKSERIIEPSQSVYSVSMKYNKK